jgi:hypothetical protein
MGEQGGRRPNYVKSSVTRSVSFSGSEPGKTAPDLIHLNEEWSMRVPSTTLPEEPARARART